MTLFDFYLIGWLNINGDNIDGTLNVLVVHRLKVRRKTALMLKRLLSRIIKSLNVTLKIPSLDSYGSGLFTQRPINWRLYINLWELTLIDLFKCFRWRVISRMINESGRVNCFWDRDLQEAGRMGSVSNMEKPF